MAQPYVAKWSNFKEKNRSLCWLLNMLQKNRCPSVENFSCCIGSLEHSPIQRFCGWNWIAVEAFRHGHWALLGSLRLAMKTKTFTKRTRKTLSHSSLNTYQVKINVTRRQDKIGLRSLWIEVNVTWKLWEEEWIKSDDLQKWREADPVTFGNGE